MLLQYLFLSIVIVMGSWTIGLLVNAMIIQQAFYERLSKLNFIRSEALNRALGVGLVKWGAKNTPFRFFNHGLRLSNQAGLDRLKEARQQMTHAEIGHLIAFVAVLLYALFMLWHGAWLFTGLLMLSNFFLNFNVCLLQQQNKRRIDRVLERFG